MAARKACKGAVWMDFDSAMRLAAARGLFSAVCSAACLGDSLAVQMVP